MTSLSEIWFSDVILPIYSLSLHSLHGVLYGAEGLFYLDAVWFISFYSFCKYWAMCVVCENSSQSPTSQCLIIFKNHFVLMNSLIKIITWLVYRSHLLTQSSTLCPQGASVQMEYGHRRHGSLYTLSPSVTCVEILAYDICMFICQPL